MKQMKQDGMIQILCFGMLEFQLLPQYVDGKQCGCQMLPDIIYR